ncbi:MAG: Beta-barrel assembly-enhancing protease [Myxococcota bacterium]|nr:Beta-barrel assembly-enhancing protease [Myxococcota bacterium]
MEMQPMAKFRKQMDVAEALSQGFYEYHEIRRLLALEDNPAPARARLREFSASLNALTRQSQDEKTYAWCMLAILDGLRGDKTGAQKKLDTARGIAAADPELLLVVLSGSLAVAGFSSYSNSVLEEALGALKKDGYEQGSEPDMDAMLNHYVHLVRERTRIETPGALTQPILISLAEQLFAERLCSQVDFRVIDYSNRTLDRSVDWLSENELPVDECLLRFRDLEIYCDADVLMYFPLLDSFDQFSHPDAVRISIIHEEAGFFAGDHYEDARTLMAAGQYEEAVEKLSNAVMYDPDFLEAHVLRGRALMMAGANAEAMVVFERLIRDYPNEPETQTIRVEYLMMRGESQEALNVVRAAIARDPENPDLHWLLAEVLVMIGDGEGAKEAGRRARELDPGNPRAEEFIRMLERLQSN